MYLCRPQKSQSNRIESVRVKAAMTVAMILLAAITGCESSEGPQRVPISGSVTLDGNDLASGVIRFVPIAASQGPAASAVIQNGKYEFSEQDGPIAGTHRVEIEATNYLGFEVDDEAAFAAAIQQTRRPLDKNPVPELFNRRSTLTADVQLEGQQEFNFNLATGKAAKTAR